MKFDGVILCAGGPNLAPRAYNFDALTLRGQNDSIPEGRGTIITYSGGHRSIILNTPPTLQLGTCLHIESYFHVCLQIWNTFVFLFICYNVCLQIWNTFLMIVISRETTL